MTETFTPADLFDFIFRSTDGCTGTTGRLVMSRHNFEQYQKQAPRTRTETNGMEWWSYGPAIVMWNPHLPDDTLCFIPH